jgi:hypothetical protein
VDDGRGWALTTHDGVGDDRVGRTVGGSICRQSIPGLVPTRRYVVHQPPGPIDRRPGACPLGTVHTIDSMMTMMMR